jgi:arylsulfatase
VSNELVHLVDLFTTLVLAGGGSVPDDRQIDGADMRPFLLGDAEESGRDSLICMNGNRIQSIKWRNWKANLFEQDTFMGPWSPLNEPHLYNLLWDPREEHQVGFPHTWVVYPIGHAAAAFMKTLVIEPPIKAGTPDPYTPPTPGEFMPESHLQIGPIVQYVTTLMEPHNGHNGHQLEPQHGMGHPAG